MEKGGGEEKTTHTSQLLGFTRLLMRFGSLHFMKSGKIQQIKNYIPA